MTHLRLQKYLAACGVASRRAAEELIRSGRVSVNGVVIQKMGVQIDPQCDRVQVDGHNVQHIEQLVYVVLNKPVGVLSSSHDNRGRRTVVDLVPQVNQRVYPVGRLDYDSQGLILLTNDGDLAVRLTHPRYGVSKVYRVLVSGHPTSATLAHLASGVELDDGLTLPARVEAIRATEDTTELEFELYEGRNRQIRRMCSAVGHPVIKLLRIRMGPLHLGDLPLGKWRMLSQDEVSALRRIVHLSSRP